MKERPILMSAPMVRAILAGTKSQTRRLVKPQPAAHEEMRLAADAPGRADADWFLVKHDALNTWVPVRCPYGAVGDRLWVRETWAAQHDFDAFKPSEIKDARWHYAATEERGGLLWRPSIHMPRWASRITLEVTGVRVERLHAITEDDAKAEGVERYDDDGVTYYGPINRGHASATVAFERLWREINGAESWDANPFVWVVEFRRGGVEP